MAFSAALKSEPAAIKKCKVKISKCKMTRLGFAVKARRAVESAKCMNFKNY
jgi:hypothetical protein